MTRCKHPGLLRAAAGAALGVQAATVMRYLAYPLSVTAGASCLSSPHTSSSDTDVHAALSLVEYLVPSLGLHILQLKAAVGEMGGSLPP